MKVGLVSVVIPNFNKSLFIEECLNSVFRQSYSMIEVIVVDDCSIDDSKLIVKRLQKKHNNLILIELAENSGVSNARNVGIDSAKGQYITFLDSDDYYINSYKIENEINCIQSGGTGNNLAYSKIVYINACGERLNGYSQKNEEYLQGNIFESIILDKNSYVIPRDFCIEASILRNVGGYRKQMKLYEDLELLLRILPNCNAICTFEEGTAYRLNTGGLSNVSEKKSLRTKWSVLWNAIKYYNSHRMYLRIRLIVRRFIIESKLVVKKLLKGYMK